MALNLTKGGLSPAKITNLSTNDVVNFMFNPQEYTISKHNTWQPETTKGKNVPRQNFQKGGPQTLKLKLYFDSLKDKTDVRTYTDNLWKMMMIDENNIDQTTGKGAPPAVAFEWGPLYFKAIITDMSQQFTLFTAEGTPVRCVVDVTLEQFTDPGSFQAQTPTAGGGQETPQTTTLIEGERLDHVAGSTSGGSSNYRQVAEANNIDNPMNVPPGTSLRV